MGFTKNDLKDGMIVENRAGVKFLVFNNYLLGLNYCSNITNFNDNLDSEDLYEDLYIDKVWDLVCVCAPLEILLKDSYYVNKYGIKIFDRYEQEEMTLDQVCKLLGRKIKIVPSK